MLEITEQHECDNCDESITHRCYCESCKDEAEQSAFDEGKKQGHNEGYDEGYAAAAKELSQAK